MTTLRLIPGPSLEDADSGPGVRRRLAVRSDRVWAGLAHTEAGAVSGWHHHGDFDSTIYVLEGGLRMEFGPGGREAFDAAPGDFVHVPPGAVHREGNPSKETATLVLFRAGQGVPTINVDGPDPG